ncbi:hypothetical protein K6V43_08460 [Streptococcus suis]|nr:hypothetical protein [Streptococcus suis]NQK94052.1 hypothetical protein [Streptococcus suis]
MASSKEAIASLYLEKSSGAVASSTITLSSICNIVSLALSEVNEVKNSPIESDSDSELLSLCIIFEITLSETIPVSISLLDCNSVVIALFSSFNSVNNSD